MLYFLVFDSDWDHNKNSLPVIFIILMTGWNSEIGMHHSHSTLISNYNTVNSCRTLKAWSAINTLEKYCCLNPTIEPLF